MASGSIGHVPASTFAEYVDDPFLDHIRDGEDASHTYTQDETTLIHGAPPARAPQCTLAQQSQPPSQCVSVRPALSHRLHSHQLHVRAKAKLQRDRLLSGPMIDIYVGESKRHWALHRNLLCHHSEALENELLGDANGNTRKDRLDLPEYDPAGFELLVKWLYQGSLDDVSDMADENQKYDYAVTCHKLYLLCERFDMTQLKNVAMDQYRKGLNEAELVPDAEEIDDIYRKSPKGSPFRLLMTRIAARQIMDPASERDVETYRGCFANNPDFAIDLVKEIRSGTGGVLFNDPTEKGNECLYHDHEAGPNCYTKDKLKGKQAKKRVGRSSAKSIPYISSDQRSRPPLPHLQTEPPPAPPLPTRPRERNPLRRCLTSPVSSTVGTSKEMAVATQPLKEALRDREKDIERLRKVSPPERRRLGPTQINGTKTHESHPALDDHHRSSEDTYRPVKDSQAASGSDGEGEGGPVQPLQTSSRRGIWEWAKAGTGRLGMIGSIPETQEDGFDISAAITSEKSDVQPDEQTPPSKVTVFGLSHSNIAPSPSFSQTKRSSDELVAASSTTTTPATLNRPTQSWTSGKQITPMPITEHSPPLTPETPTPPQRRRDTPVDTNGTTTPPPPKNTPAVENASAAKSQSNGASPTTASPATQTASGSKTPPVRKYKIVLNPNMISPGRSSPSMAK
ncbi:CLT [Curvularia clavata]|uniref:CLT n=1 Tax=Curvularia clavata TaxID=95742 RepID=A0A9Q8Z5H4_CURCL|nr:CLT [Curvularia clavata]